MTDPDNRPPSPHSDDISFEVSSAGYEIWFSDRIANDHPDLVDQCADWLEDQIGVLNLGQIEHSMLIADGPLTDEVKNGLIDWWAQRAEGLNLP